MVSCLIQDVSKLTVTELPFAHDFYSYILEENWVKMRGTADLFSIVILFFSSREEFEKRDARSYLFEKSRLVFLKISRSITKK